MCPIRVMVLSGFMRKSMVRKVEVRMMSKQSCMENGACSASERCEPSVYRLLLP